jgi:hypothetical protein
MPRRFEGAITTPADSGEVPDASIPPEPRRPPRPALVELSAAILIIGGVVDLATGMSPFQPGGLPLGVLFAALDILTIVVGVLIRLGRGWVLALNVTAIALFLELTALPSPIALLMAILDTVVMFTLIRHRPWFEWRPPTDDALVGASERGL